MPSENRVKTFTAYTDGTDPNEQITASDLNEIQDRIVYYRAMTQDASGFSLNPSGITRTWSGATWIYGEFTAATSGGGGYVTKVLDAARDWKSRNCIVYAVYVTPASNFLPSQAAHFPSNIPAAQCVSYIWNTQNGTNVAAPAEGDNAWRPWPAVYATGYFAVNSANGNLVFLNNDAGPGNIEVYFLVQLSKDTDGNYQTENQVITLSSSVEDRIIDADELNELQDSVVMAEPMGKDEAGLPSLWRGGQWVFGEFSLATGANTLHAPRNYWTSEFIDYRERPYLVHAASVSDATDLPSGLPADHTPSNITATAARLASTNDGGAASLMEYIVGDNAYLYSYPTASPHAIMDSNASGGTLQHYMAAMMLRADAATVDTSENRLKSMADYGRVTTKMLTDIQDNATFYYPMSAEEAGLPATFLGGTVTYGEFSVAARPGGAGTFTNKQMCDAIDYRDRMMLLYISQINTGGGYTLPSGINYEPNIGTGISVEDCMLWDTGSDVVIGAPGVGNHAWNFNAASVWFYAESVAGNLYVSNGTAAAVTFMALAFISGPTR